MSSCITGDGCRARISTGEAIAKPWDLTTSDLFSPSSHHWRMAPGLKRSNNGCLREISRTKDSAQWFGSAGGATIQAGYCSSSVAAKSDAKQLGDIFIIIRALAGSN